MFIFKNFIVAFILMGIITRVSNHFFFKYLLNKKTSICISHFAVGVVFCPLSAFFLGFDVAVTEYLISLLIWFLFDLATKGGKK